MRSQSLTTDNDVALFGRLKEGETLTPDAARYLLGLDFRPEDRSRMNELSVKAQQGTLQQAEEGDLDEYNRVGHLLAFWQSKARQSLHQANTPS